MSAADRQSEERDASPSERSAEVSDDEAADVGARELSPSDHGWNIAVTIAAPVRALARATAAILNIRMVDAPLVEDYRRVGLRERNGGRGCSQPPCLRSPSLRAGVLIRRFAAVIEGAVWPAT